MYIIIGMIVTAILFVVTMTSFIRIATRGVSSKYVNYLFWISITAYLITFIIAVIEGLK